MKILITGITGFVGSHLADYALAKNNVEVYGAARWRSRRDNVKHIEKEVTLIECDIRDASSVFKVLEDVQPDYCFHLAAQSFIPTSWSAPSETLTTNIIGELNVFEAIRELKLGTRVLVACSSEEYGKVNSDELPIKETNPLCPLSPYGVSKVGQDFLGYQYYQTYGMHIVRTRAFNHEGPRRGEVFVTSNFAKQIAEIEKGTKEPVLYVGNLEAKRDFTDVRDTVHAYWLALEKCDPGDVYNIASGKSITIRSMLNMLLDLTDVGIEVKQDPCRMRLSDVLVLKGDSTKFKDKTGWEPKIPFKKTLEDLLNYWRERL